MMPVKDETMRSPVSESQSSSGRESDSVPALRRAVKILDMVGRRDIPPSAADIARELSLPRSSTHGLINTMVELGLLEAAQGSAHMGYRLGGRLLDWAEQAGGRHDLVGAFHQIIGASPELAAYTVSLSILEGSEVVYLASRTSERGLGVHYAVGMRLPAVYTAVGMAQLSAMETGRFREWLALYPTSTWPAPLTSHGARSPTEVLEQIREVQERGYAVDNEQIHHGVWCFAAAVRAADGSVVAGLGLSQPKGVDAERDAPLLARLSISTAATLSARMGYRQR
ncbi:IclR family transcriptional regulator [Acetobacter sacchari]|nr:IclR family transcriptional regulator [Acetobacter sacchari]